MCDQSNPKAKNYRVVYEEDNQEIAKGSIPDQNFYEGLILTLYFVMMKLLPLHLMTAMAIMKKNQLWRPQMICIREISEVESIVQHVMIGFVLFWNVQEIFSHNK